MILRIPKKPLIVLAIFYLIGMIESCCKDNPVENYKITDLNFYNFDLATLNNTDISEIEFSSFALQIKFNTEIIARTFQSNFLLNTAYAYDCDDDIIPNLVNRIENAEITSNADFNSNYPAGTSLNNLFQFRRVIKECVENGGDILDGCGENSFDFSFNSTLSDVLNNTFAQNDYYNAIPSNLTNLNLAILKTQPTTNEPIQFTLNILFQNGQTLSITTEQIVIN